MPAAHLPNEVCRLMPSARLPPDAFGPFAERGLPKKNAGREAPGSELPIGRGG